MASVTGTVSIGNLQVTEDSLVFDQLVDVTASAPTHDDVVIYKDSAIDPGFTDGWHSVPLVLENMTNVASVSEPAHNEILVWNENATDPAYATGWVNKGISSVFTGLTATINGLVAANEAVVKSKSGNMSLGDMIMMSDTLSGSGTANVSIGSTADNNAIFKKELTDPAFIFVQSLSKGEIANLTYTTGTILRGSKGIYGLTGPFPTPLGITGLSFKKSRFSTTLANTSVICASVGTDCEITLFESDGTTISDGPTVISANNVTVLNCSGTGEFFLNSTGAISAVVNGNGSQIRVLPPMATELICWNRDNTVSSLDGVANVDWYRRSGVTGTTVVTSGTPTALGAGSNVGFGLNGCVILRSDKPISCFTTDDGSGNQSVPGWPLDNLAQSFPNPSFMDNNADTSISLIAIGSPYAGTATVYDSSGTEIATFTITRTTNPAVTAADQLAPAAGRWQPEDDALASLDGGYVETNVPAVCFMNFNGSSVWTGSTGDEMAIAGSTPVEIKAEIKIDASGLARRRDVDGSGVVTWNIC